MPLSSKQLREDRHKVALEIRGMADLLDDRATKEFTSEEQEKWTRINAAYDGYLGTAEKPGPLAIAERAEAIGAAQVAPVGDRRIGRDDMNAQPASPVAAITDQHRTLAMAAWFRCQMDRDLTDEQLDACRAIGFRPDRQALNIGLYDTANIQALSSRFRHTHPSQAMDRVTDFRATLTGQSGPGGGYLIAPEQMVRNLEINMLYYGGMLQVAETITTTSGERMTWPTADDTGNTGVQLGESVTIGSSVDPTFAQVYWDAYKFSSQPILVPFELLEDSVFNLPQVLGELLGIRLGRVQNTKYTTGTGAATPKGLITAASSVSAISSTALVADDLISLWHSIDPAYRTAGMGWMMHDNIVQALRKLKDGMGRYLWQDGLQNNSPDRLLGAPLTLNQDMDSTIASGKKTVLFGQLFKYKVRRVNGIRLYRLQERYRDTDQDAFIAFIRADGNLLDAGTHPVKYLSH